MIRKKLNREEWHEHFVWWPVETICGHSLCWERAERRWNQHINLQIIDPFDLGEYAGGWEYRLPPNEQ